VAGGSNLEAAGSVHLWGYVQYPTALGRIVSEKILHTLDCQRGRDGKRLPEIERLLGSRAMRKGRVLTNATLAYSSPPAHVPCAQYDPWDLPRLRASSC